MPEKIEAKSEEKYSTTNFIKQIIEEDLKTGKHKTIHTRFPPEPNGYLHIGHAKSICLNFGLAEEFGGKTNLRFDDTNPTKEDVEYVESIKEDVRWLGFTWEDREYYASDYFDKLFDYAMTLIKQGKAFVCDLPAEKIREYRGTLTEEGKESPYRNRSIEENLELFLEMKKGTFPDGSKTLRAKIDMKHGNLNMRDPVLYRILHTSHHRSGDKWCIYPMYDWAHGQSDSIEGITHSLCTLEFEDHRPLYNWFIEQLGIYPSRQIEFARLNLTFTVMSKRKLLMLVQEGHVNGWDDPRMPTISGLRRRGYTPKAIRDFADRIGVAKKESMVDLALLEFCIREDLNKHAQRRQVVLDPIKVKITNYPENQSEKLEAINNPEDDGAGSRLLDFSNEIFIERTDFMDTPTKKYYRLAPGREVRLRYAYFITCTNVIKDNQGNIIELHCTYDPASRGGNSPDGRKVQGTIHWVSAKHSIDCQVRLYENLFLSENPYDTEDGDDFTKNINPNSLKVITAKTEPSLKTALPGEKFQFERMGYFCVDKDSNEDSIVFNRTVTLRDTWAKLQNK